MKLIYVAGPYSADTRYGIRANIEKAEHAAMELAIAGWAVICPHKNTAHWEQSYILFPKGKETLLEIDLEILRRCDAIYLLSQWYKSEGTMGEFEKADNLCLDIYFEDDGIPEPGE